MSDREVEPLEGRRTAFSHRQHHPPARIDIRAAQEIDEAQAETARWVDRTVGAIARGAGLETEVLAVAELPQIAVSETIVRVACERDCCAVLVAARAPLVTAQAER